MDGDGVKRSAPSSQGGPLGDITAYSKIDWERFSQWVVCIAAVTFDLEAGQDIEEMLPAQHSFPKSIRDNIKGLAFPDNNSGCVGDMSYTFRFKNHAHPKAATQPRTARPQEQQHHSATAAAMAHLPRFLFGFVYFRQVPDPSNPRGYFQKSVVVVSTRPLFALYHSIAGVVARCYFATGRPAIPSACADLARWPKPEAGFEGELSLLGLPVKVSLPREASLISCLYAQPTSDSGCKSARAQRALDLFCCLKPMLADIHRLWELVLTSAPMLVFSSTPALCSRTILTLITMIAPLEFCGDFRPFFTITDPDCRHYAAKANRDRSGSAVKHAALLGVTNPYFEKEYSHWETCVHVPQSFGPTAGLRRQPRRSHTSDTALNTLHIAGSSHHPGGTTAPRSGRSVPSSKKQQRPPSHGQSSVEGARERGAQVRGGRDDVQGRGTQEGDSDDADDGDGGCAFGALEGDDVEAYDDGYEDDDAFGVADTHDNVDAVASDLSMAAPTDRFSVRLPTRPNRGQWQQHGHAPQSSSIPKTAGGSGTGNGGDNHDETDEDVLARTTAAIHGSFAHVRDLKASSPGGVRTLHKGFSDSATGAPWNGASVLSSPFTALQQQQHQQQQQGCSTPQPTSSSSSSSPATAQAAAAERLKHTKAAIPLRPVPSPRSTSTSSKRSPVLGRTQSRTPEAGVKSSMHVFLESDHLLVCKLLKEDPHTVQDFIRAGKAVEQSLASLTQTFLIPLEQYTARLMPLKEAIAPFKDVPQIGAFNPDDFFNHVKDMLSRLRETRDGDWLGLYDKFLRSRNFRGWWAKKRKTVNAGLVKVYLKTVVEQGPALIPSLNEVHSIDLLLRVQEALKSMEAMHRVDADLVEATRQTIQQLISNLPADTRQSMSQASPAQ